MTDESLELVAGETLASYLSRGGLFAGHEACRLVARVAGEIAELHAEGRLHLSVSVETVSFEERSDVRLSAVKESHTFGGSSSHQESTPPALRRDDVLQVPTRIEAAQDVFDRAGIPIPPTQIDIFQVGALLCRLTSGESLQDYLRSPRAKEKVPHDVQRVIDCSLGHDRGNRFEDIWAFETAVRTLISPDEPTLVGIAPSAQDTSPSLAPNDSVPDTVIDAAHSEPASARSDVPFQTLGHFRIDSKIGHGGMGDVYKAYEEALDRTVAIKVLPPDFSRQDEFVRRFYAEATGAAKLVHPNIVQVYFIGEDRGHHFFAMQYVEGESLGDLLGRRGRLSIDEALAITEQTLSGLAAAHRQDMVHRDIKPGNILLDSENRRAVLADFGLVKSLQSSGAMTATGMVMGTVDYISPEQARGQSVDARSDLYSIGVLLYQMLSGRLPFEADSPTAMIFQHVYEEPRPLSERDSAIPGPFCRIVAKLMAKPPSQRYQSADELRADLTAFRLGQPLPSGADITTPGEVSAGDHVVAAADMNAASDIPSRHTVLIEAPQFDAAPSLPTDLDGLSPGGWWKQLGNRVWELLQQRAPAVVQHLQNTQQQVDGAVDEYQRRHRVLQQVVGEAESALQELTTQKAHWQQAIEESSAKVEQAEGDETAVREAVQTRTRAEATLEELKGQIDQQGDQLASMRIRLSQVRATLEKLRSQRDLLAARMKVAQAQLRVAGGSVVGSRWHRFRPSTWPKRTQTMLVLGLFVAAAGLFYFRSTDPKADNDPSPPSTADQTLIETPLLPPAVPVQQFVGHDGECRVVLLSPDEKRVASGGQDGTVRLWDLAGIPVQTFEHGHSVGAIAFSGSGRFLASGSATGRDTRKNPSQVKIFDVNEGALKRVMAGDNTMVRDLAFTSDEKVLIGIRRLPLPVCVVRWDVDTGKELDSFDIPQEFLKTDRVTRPLAMSSDGALLAAVNASQQIRLISVSDPKDSRTLEVRPRPTDESRTGATFSINAVALSPDGSILSMTDRQGNIALWDVASEKKLDQIGGLKHPMKVVAMSRRGRRVALGDSRSAGRRAKQTLKIWIPGRRQIVQSVNIPSQLTIRNGAVALHSDGLHLLTGSTHPSLVMWELLPSPVRTTQSVEYRGGGGLLAVSKDRTQILAASDQSDLGVWDDPEGETFRTFDPLVGEVHTIDLSPDGRLGAAGGATGQLALWNVETGRLLRQVNLNVTFDPPVGTSEDEARRRRKANSDIRRIFILPGNGRAVVATNNSLFIWDLKTGTESHHFPRAPRGISLAAISPDGNLVVTADRYSTRAGDGKNKEPILRVWDIMGGKQTRTLGGRFGHLNSVAFSDDGRRFLTAGEGAVHLWDVATWTDVRQYQILGEDGDPTDLHSVSFSPDDTRAAALAGRYVVEWNLATGEELVRAGPIAAGLTSGPNRSLTYTPDGRQFITSGQGTTQLWAAGATSSTERSTDED